MVPQQCPYTLVSCKFYNIKFFDCNPPSTGINRPPFCEQSTPAILALNHAPQMLLVLAATVRCMLHASQIALTLTSYPKSSVQSSSTSKTSGILSEFPKRPNKHRQTTNGCPTEGQRYQQQPQGFPLLPPASSAFAFDLLQPFHHLASLLTVLAQCLRLGGYLV